jgi:hypothetical protein
LPHGLIHIRSSFLDRALTMQRWRLSSGLASAGAQARLVRVKLVAFGAFALGMLVVNQRATETAVSMFGLHGFYPPWQWAVWWAQWHAASAYQPVWNACSHIVLMPSLVMAGIAIAAIVIARHLLTGESADLYGSARWASRRDMDKAGLLAGWLARLTRKRRVGIILGAWRGLYLRDCSPGHLLVVAPTRSGKGVGVVIPTLLTWPHSAFGISHDDQAGIDQSGADISLLEYDDHPEHRTNPVLADRSYFVSRLEDTRNHLHDADSWANLRPKMIDPLPYPEIRKAPAPRARRATGRSRPLKLGTAMQCSASATPGILRPNPQGSK